MVDGILVIGFAHAARCVGLAVSFCHRASYTTQVWRERQRIVMANVVVVGAQWGDEGKGKIVDWLSERADVIARFQGGHNAGHTLVIDGEVFKLSLLPSGYCARWKTVGYRKWRGA